MRDRLKPGQETWYEILDMHEPDEESDEIVYHSEHPFGSYHNNPL